MTVDSFTKRQPSNEERGLELTNVRRKKESSTSSSNSPVSSSHQDPSEAVLSSAVKEFIQTMGWTEHDLQSHHISPSTLNQLLSVENSRVWNSLRWASMDQWLARVLHYPLLDFGGLGHNADSLKQLSMNSWSRFRMKGRSLPLQSDWTIRKAVAADGFREGLEFGIAQGLKLTLTALLMYQMAQPSDNILAVYQSANTNSILALSGQFHQHPGLFTLFAFPPVYGLLKALLALKPADKLSSLVLAQAEQFLKKMTPGTFNDYIRWFLPLNPLANALQNLEVGLLWDGRADKVTIKDREQAFHFIQQVATQRQGLTQTEGLKGLYRLAYALNLKDMDKLKGVQDPQTLLHLLSIKTRAFESLKDIPLTSRRTQAYQAYYLWALGHSPSFWKTSVPMGTLKATRLTAQVLSLTAILKTILAYLNCPERPGLSFTGYEKWSSDYTQPCFDEFVRLFNTIPGQPSHTLTDVIPQYYFPDNTYSLDLSGKGVEETSILTILQGFIDQHQQGKGPALTGLNLSNNQFGSQGDQNTVALVNLLKQFPQLTTLDLSYNQIGLDGIQGVQTLANTLPQLSALTSFKILPSRTLSAKMVGMFNLTNSPDLLPQPSLLTTADDVRVFFQTAPLNTTTFDLSRKVTDDPQGQVLSTLMNSLKDYQALTSVDLSNNLIGLTSDQGITNLAQGLAHLPSLQSLILSKNYIGHFSDQGALTLSESLNHLYSLTQLDLSNNWYGSQGNKSVQVLTQSLQQALLLLQNFTFLPSSFPLSFSILNSLNLGLKDRPHIPLLPVPLIDSQSVQLFFQAVTPTRTALNFSSLIPDDVQGTTLTALMKCLNPYNKTLTSLDLSNNNIGYQSDIGTRAIGNSLGKLTSLTFLDLSNNYYLGSMSNTGLQFIGNSLQYLPHLTFFSLNNNHRLEWVADTGIITIGNNLRYLTALTSLNLRNTDIGRYIDGGTQAIGNNLKYLTALTSLDFSNNDFLALYSDNGTQAIGNSLKYLTRLIFLDFSKNPNFGYHGDTGIETIAQDLRNLSSLKIFNILPAPSLSSTAINTLNLALATYTYFPLLPTRLTDSESIKAYFSTVNKTASTFNFSGMINDDAQGATLTTFMQYLKQYNNTLTSLKISNKNLGHLSDNGTQVLGNNLRYFPYLTYLDLSNNFYIGSQGDIGTQAIGNNLKYLTALTYFNLSNTYIGSNGDAGTQAIGNSLKYLTTLTYLDLSHSYYFGSSDDAGIQAIGNSLQYLPHLTYFNLKYSHFLGSLGDNGLQAIGNSLQHLPHLTYLDFSYTSIGSTSDISTQVIGNNLQYLKNLIFLDFSYTSIGQRGDKGVQAIGKSLNNLTSLCSLYLDSNFIGYQGTQGIEVLIQGLKSLSFLETFTISPNPYISAINIERLNLAATYHPFIPASSILLKDRDSVLAYFQTVLPLTTSFSFSSNLTDDATGSVLSTLMQSLSLYNQTLTTLDLSHNNIGSSGEAGTIVIGKTLPVFQKLTSVDLSYNNIGYQSSNGSVVLGQSLNQLPSLTSLNLGYNMIGSTGPQGSLAIVSAIPSLTNLQNLNLNNMTNIQWDQNLEQINSFTNRRLQEVCQSQLCHGTAITSVKNNPGSAANQKLSTSSASRLQTPWSFKMINSSVKGLKNGFIYSYQTAYRFIDDLPIRAPFSILGLYLDQAYEHLLNNIGESLKEVTSNSPAYFPNIENTIISDWQPNPLTELEQPSVDYTHLASYAIPQPLAANTTIYFLAQ